MSRDRVTHLARKEVSGMSVKSFGPSIEELKREYGLTEIINLSLNENPLGASPKGMERVKAAAGEMGLYPDPAAREFRSLIARKHGIQMDQVIQGNGVAELITFLGQAFIDKGDEIITPEPIFIAFQRTTTIMGGRNILSPLKEYRIDLEDMLNKITRKTKLIIIVNPNNPTGDILKSSELDGFLSEVGKHRIVVLDEAYGLYVDHPEYPDSVKYIKQGFNVIVLRTLSKAYGLAGLRVGYALSSAEIISRMESVRDYFNVNRFAQIAAVEALKDRQHLDASLTLIRKEKGYYYSEFDRMGLFYVPSYANFVFVRVGVDDIELAKALLKRGVIISSMTSDGYKGFIRVTIGNHDQNEKMIACLKQVIEELR